MRDRSTLYLDEPGNATSGAGDAVDLKLAGTPDHGTAGLEDGKGHRRSLAVFEARPRRHGGGLVASPTRAIARSAPSERADGHGHGALAVRWNRGLEATFVDAPSPPGDGSARCFGYGAPPRCRQARSSTGGARGRGLTTCREVPGVPLLNLTGRALQQARSRHHTSGRPERPRHGGRQPLDPEQIPRPRSGRRGGLSGSSRSVSRPFDPGYGRKKCFTRKQKPGLLRHCGNPARGRLMQPNAEATWC